MKKKSILLITLALLSTLPNAYAEYYVNYEAPMVCMGSCNSCSERCYSTHKTSHHRHTHHRYYSCHAVYSYCGCEKSSCYHYIRSVAPYRHSTSGAGQVEEYEWYGDP